MDAKEACSTPRVLTGPMTTQEMNRAIQYVTSRTSYGRKTVADILGIGFRELTSLGRASSRSFDQETLREYVCQWTIKRTGCPEPLVREVLGCAARWMDAMCLQILGEQPALPQGPEV